jgi:hypothetical protein
MFSSEWFPEFLRSSMARGLLGRDQRRGEDTQVSFSAQTIDVLERESQNVTLKEG